MGMEVAEGGELNPQHFIRDIFRYAPNVQKIAQIDLESPFTTDSSDMSIEQWVQLGNLLDQHMDEYDGFVIIHGTDTMSYTASALSYMLVNLPKPVILTGAQRPLTALRTDARDNLVGAIELATKPIPEVGVFFDNKLFRGNRTKKRSIDEFNAFISPNYPPLATVGLHIERGAPHRKPEGLFRVESAFDNRVLTMPVFPGLPSNHWEYMLDTDAQILILSAFGAGNIPVNSGGVLTLIQEFTKRDKLVVLTSQCPEGTCDLSLYGGGRAAQEAGAISASDMTFEATVVKAMFLLGLFKAKIKRVRHYFTRSIAGEMSDQTSLILQ